MIVVYIIIGIIAVSIIANSCYTLGKVAGYKEADKDWEKVLKIKESTIQLLDSMIDRQ